MEEATKKTLNELFPGWTPTTIEDDEGLDFDKPIKGKYVVRIAGVNRYSGTQKDGETPYDFVSLNLQVVDDIEGDISANRYLGKTYSCIDGKFSTAQEDLQALLNDLFTANLIDGLGITSGGMEGILEVSDGLIDKTMNVTCWKTKGGKQAVKVVKEHKVKKSEESSDVDWD